MDSIWKSSTQMPEFPVLKSNKKTDVLIIGGGITGLLCAHFLQERGVDYILAENLLRRHPEHNGENNGSAWANLQ